MDLSSIGGSYGQMSQQQLKIQQAKQAEAAAGGKGGTEDLKKACRDFEALFIKQMLDAMRKTVPEYSPMEGGQAEEIFEDMLYDEYAQKMAKTSSLGLSEMMYSQLKPSQSGLPGASGI